MTDDHRWAMAIVVDMDEPTAAHFHAMDLPDRMAAACSIIEAGAVNAVRGPLCSQCRVHWRDVYAQPDKPWPCKGERPAQLGGPLTPPETPKSRQERRRERRSAVKASAAPKATATDPVSEAVRRAATDAHARTERAKRERAAEPIEVTFRDPAPCRPERVRV